jgi:hypothetical protein
MKLGDTEGQTDILILIFYNFGFTIMNRLERLNWQMYKNERGPNDIVILDAVRTPLTKAKRGSLKDTGP